jgi:branched-chain amino acid transport system ATP-binding protein
MAIVLEINHLFKTFGGVQAIDDFSIKLDEGNIYGLIGPNGAGKTTIFNTITGIYKPTSGSIRFMGQNITGMKPFQIAKMGIARTFQNIRLFGNLSVLDNVFIACHLDAGYNIFNAVTRLGSFKEIEAQLKSKSFDLLNMVGLKDYMNDKAGSLPYGHQRKLEIARALALKPKLLLLDEPAAGMNCEESEELVGFIKEIHERYRITILMIEHHMDVVMNLCHRITVLNFGRSIAEGTPKEIQTNKTVIEAYLGGEE